MIKTLLLIITFVPNISFAGLKPIRTPAESAYICLKEIEKAKLNKKSVPLPAFLPQDLFGPHVKDMYSIGNGVITIYEDSGEVTVLNDQYSLGVTKAQPGACLSSRTGESKSLDLVKTIFQTHKDFIKEQRDAILKSDATDEKKDLAKKAIKDFEDLVNEAKRLCADADVPKEYLAITLPPVTKHRPGQQN